MTYARICGVDIYIDRDPNAKLYYFRIQYRGKMELPTMLGEFIEPLRVYNLICAYLRENRIKCKPKIIKDRIANLLQSTFKKMGVEDEKTLDLKLFRWKRISHK